MENEIIKPGVYRDMSNDAYHSSAGISKSGLSLIQKCPALYYDRYIIGNKSEPTPAMVTGSATHKMVFEPGTFNDEFAVAPKVDKRTKAGKAEYAEFEQESVGKIVIDAKSFDEIEAIAFSVRTHKSAASFLDDGIAEASIFHIDQTFKQLVKVRPDWMRPQGIIVDLKTTTDASKEAFSMACANFGYDMQAAMYIDIATAVTGIEYHTFVFIVVEKTAPYQVAIYFADNEMLSIGRDKYNEAMTSYVEMVERNYWPGYNNDQIVAISLPRWEVNKHENRQPAFA